MERRHFFGIFFASLFIIPIFAQANKKNDTKIEAISSVNWITKEFTTNISLDTRKAEISMPSGKKIASNYIKSKMVPLIQPPLLSLFENSENDISEAVINDFLTLDQVYHFILGGHKTPDVFSKDLNYLNTTNKNNLTDFLYVIITPTHRKNQLKLYHRALSAALLLMQEVPSQFTENM